MRILAIEPYYGGSHAAFLDGWRSRSRHDWTPLTLPASHWKWRMRHAAVTFADEVARRAADGQSWDALWCSDMLNLAEWRGLAPPAVRDLPCVAYFHENQLTYPVRHPDERDLQLAFTNLTTALAATQVWFNSEFHRDSFLSALDEMLRRMPDRAPRHCVEAIRAKSNVQPPGIEPFEKRPPRSPGPLRIGWAARWEYDKDPETFFQALDQLIERGVDFRVSVLGQRFSECPLVFERARRRLAATGRIDHWGYLAGREAYRAALQTIDVIVSTARHEFFGLAVVEAVAAGAYPVLPRRLAYPEIFGLAVAEAVAAGAYPVPPTRRAYPEILGANGSDDFFYGAGNSGGADALADRLAQLAQRLADPKPWENALGRAAACVGRFSWPVRAPALDKALAHL